MATIDTTPATWATIVGHHEGDNARVPAEAIDAYARAVVGAGARVRLGRLLRTPPATALYHQPDRHGVTVVAVTTADLAPPDLATLLRFRFAQYVDIGFVNLYQAYAAGMAAEPTTHVGADDVHVVAGVPATGEILCYAVIEQPPDARDGVRLRSSDRPLFPVERIHGAGIFNRLPILPDLPVNRIRELGRFVRNHRPLATRDQVTRAVVELGVGVFRVMAGPLRLHVDAVIGDLEERVAKVKLDFFHIPTVVLHGTVPYEHSAAYLYPRYLRHTVYPFACLSSDIAPALPRLDAIDRALARPGKLGMLSLRALRGRGRIAPSILHIDGQGPFDDTMLAQPSTDMATRARLRAEGTRLRDVAAFADLSTAEAALLSTLMQRVRVPAGTRILRQGDPGDAFYLIESGEAGVEVTDSAERSAQIAALGAGQCCGYAAVATGTEHCADVVARTDMTLLRLSKQAHDTYLAQLAGVGDRLGRDALQQVVDVDRGRREHAAAHPGCDDDCGCCGPGADDGRTC